MKSIKTIYYIFLHILFAMLQFAFVYSLLYHEHIIAFMCPAAISALKGMLWADRKDGLI